MKFTHTPKGIIHVGAGQMEELEYYTGLGCPLLYVDVFTPCKQRLSLLGKDQNFVQACLGEKREARKFHTASNKLSGSVLPFDKHLIIEPGITPGVVLDVQVIPTDVVAGLLPVADTLVLDVQGNELSVLKGLGSQLSRFDWIIAEFSDQELYTGQVLREDLFEWLSWQGFQLAGLEYEQSPWWGNVMFRRELPWWETPRQKPAKEDCLFYHTHDEDDKVVVGEWDFRGSEAAYFGGLDLAGKSLLDVGTASGDFAFWAERQGATVTAVDTRQHWDLIPHLGVERCDEKETVRRVKNAFWYNWHRLGSKAKVAYVDANKLPRWIGLHDVVMVGCIMLHNHDPFGLLRSAATLAKDTVVVVNPTTHVTKILPNLGICDLDWGSWWLLASEDVSRMLHVLGFHKQTFNTVNGKTKHEVLQSFDVIVAKKA